MNTWSLIDKVTDALGEFLDAVKQKKADLPAFSSTA